jgi:hypothetical protein
MNGDIPGTQLEGDIPRADLENMGRQIAVALLRSGAGEGPPMEVETAFGELFGTCLANILDQLVAAEIARTRQGALIRAFRLQLGLTLQDLLAAAGTQIELSLRPLLDSPQPSPVEEPDTSQQASQQADPLDEQALDLLNAAGLKPMQAGIVTSVAQAIKLLGACGLAEGAPFLARVPIAALVDGAITRLRNADAAVGTATEDDGNAVNEKTRERFLKYYGPGSARRSEILMERTIYRASGQISVATASWKLRGPYLRLWLALQSPRGTGSRLRYDLADLRQLHLWEVKPAGSLTHALGQICYYIAAYNCITRATAPNERLMVAGGSIDGRMLAPVPLPPGPRGRPRIAVPFRIVQLPGILPYMVLVLPSGEELRNATMAALFAKLAQELRRWRARSQAAASEIPVELLVLMALGFIVVGGVAAVGVEALVVFLARVLAPLALSSPVLVPALARGEDFPNAQSLGIDDSQTWQVDTFAGSMSCVPSKVGDMLTLLQVLTLAPLLGGASQKQ